MWLQTVVIVRLLRGQKQANAATMPLRGKNAVAVHFQKADPNPTASAAIAK
jgi:hypothetical protein